MSRHGNSSGSDSSGGMQRAGAAAPMSGADVKRAWSAERRQPLRVHRLASNYRLLARLIAEFLGTAFLVYFAGGAAAAVGGSVVTKAFAYGFGVSLLTLVLIEVSYAHMNPFITLVVALSGERQLGWLDALLYMLAQLGGSAVGGAFLLVTFGGASTLGRPAFGVGVTLVQALFVEALFGYVTVAYYVFLVLEARGGWTMALGAGLVPLVGTLVANTVSGAALNPYFAFGTSVYAGFITSQQWVYWVGPLIGAALVLPTYWLSKTKLLLAKGAAPKPAHQTP